MIKILRVKLQNFMCIENADLYFPNNKSVMIVGQNRSGKSAVLCSIGLAFSSYKKGPTFNDYIKKDKDDASVFLEAEINDNPITFDLKMKRGSSSIKRTIIYKEEEYINSECDKVLEDLNVAYFSNVIFSMQDEGDITKMKPSARADLLSRLLEFDFTEKVKKLTEYISELKEKASDNNSQISFNEDLIKEKKNQIKEISELDFTAKDVSDTQEKLDSIREKINEYDKKIEANMKISEEIEKIRVPLDENKTKLSEIEKKISSNESKIESLNREITEYDSTKKSIENDIASIENKLTELDETETNQLDEYTSSQDNISSMKEKIKLNQKEITNETVNISKASSTIADKTSDIEFMKQGSCPTCGHDIDQTNIPTLENEIKELEKLREESRNKQQELYKKDESLEKELKEIEKDSESLHSKLTRTSQIIKTSNENITSLKDKLSKLEKPQQSVIDSYKETLSKFVVEKVELEEKIIKYNEEISKLDKSKNILARDEKTNLKNEESTLDNKIKEFNSKMANNVKIEQDNKRVSEEIEKCKEKIEAIKTTNVSLNEEIDDNTEAKKVLDKDFPQYLIVKTCDKLEKRINRFIKSVFGSMTIKMYQDKKGVDFFYVPEEYKTDPEDKDSWINISMSSGCEKSALSVGWRVALAESYGLDILMLDECDATATDDSSEKLLGAVLDSSKFSQVFIITHKKETRDFLINSKDIKVYYASKGEFFDDDPEEYEAI